jgi:hypothetical protein
MGRRFRLAQFLGQHGYLPRRLIGAARSGENLRRNARRAITSGPVRSAQGTMLVTGG